MTVLSLIIPVFNTEKYLERCLDSVAKQSFRQIEVIIVNDFSPGNVEEIIRKYENLFYKFVYVKHEYNRGLFLARLTGVSHATGDFIAFLDSDDHITRDYYRKLVINAEKEEADITIGRTIIEKPDGSRFVYNLHDISLRFAPLSGHEVIRKRFWEQEGLCYSWHTIWNKIYSKKLWEQALNSLQKINSHVIMTEDIAFSSVLFHFAKKVISVDNDGYFYCENANASTDSKNLSLKKFKKNISDMTVVFDFVQEFLTAQDAPAEIMEHYFSFRKYYGKMWKTHALTSYSGAEKKEALAAVEHFVPNLNEKMLAEDHFFNVQTTPWNGGLEYAKDLIAEKRFTWISFDIFDTLLKRPFYKPEHLFFMLDPEFRKLAKTNAAFHKIRIEGEMLARKKWGKRAPGREDITLSQIYDVIAKIYGLSAEVANAMMQQEINLEKTFLSVRDAGKELYDFAMAIGKKVILTSDMYLEKDVLEDILSLNGYSGYQKLFLSSDVGLTKNTGGLFKHVLTELQIKGDELLHIGDTWHGDIVNPQKLKIQTFFLPKAKDAMENQIQGIQTNACAIIGDYVCSDAVNRKKYKDSIGYGALIATAANKYFDNPYRYFNKETDFNIDPYFVGYYPTGLHLLGFVKWLLEESTAYGYKKLYFMSRDGYLPLMVYKQLSSLYPNAPAAEYIYTSRKALMPFILETPYDFFNMPIEIANHTPATVLSLLDFCSKKQNKQEIFCDLLSTLKMNETDCFSDVEQYYRFIQEFLTVLYDPKRHQEAKNLCTAYYSRITSDSATVDLGYSGRIQGAVCSAVGHGVDVFFIHADDKQYKEKQKRHSFEIHAFYDFSPCMTGLIREHIFSSSTPSCIGFEKNGEEVYPVFEAAYKTWQDKFVIQKIHEGTLDFIDDFIQTFKNYYNDIPLKPTEISFPFEGYLRYMKPADMGLFDASFFEDTVYGAREMLKISNFLQQQYTEYNISNQLTSTVPVSQISFNNMLSAKLSSKNRLLKFLVYLLIDKEALRTKLWFSLQDKPIAFRISRYIYRRFFRNL